MASLFLQLIFYGIPIASAVYFAVSLYRYFSAKKANSHDPNAHDEADMAERKRHLTVSATMFCIFAALIIGVAVLLFSAVAFM